MKTLRSQLTFRQRFSRAFHQARKNKFLTQEIVDWIGNNWTKFLGICISIIGLLAVNSGHAAVMSNYIEQYIVLIIAAFIFPHFLFVITFATALIVRFKETYVDEPSRLAGGIEPNESTMKFAATKSRNQFLLGGVIEVISHPFLDKRISNNGWHPDSVTIRNSRRPFEISDELKSDHVASGDNHKKYSLIRSSRPTTDDYGALNLEVATTSYQKIEGARKLTDNNVAMRHLFSDVAPENHKIPNSLCLHAIIMLSDGNVIAMKRRKQTSYFPNAISVSFEEQLAKIDFHTERSSASHNLFRRGICEEIFPLANRYEIDPNETWSRIEDYIDHYRYWSLMFEESIGNFALFGVCKMRLNLNEYIDAFVQIQNEYKGIRDDEGRLYFMTKGLIEDYLVSGHGLVNSINFFDKTDHTAEAIKSVHPTMPYRCATLLSCL